MENSQSQQQPSSEVNTSTSEYKMTTEVSAATPTFASTAWNQTQAKWNGFTTFINRHPFLIWGGLSTTLVAMVGVSVLSLTYAGREEQEQEQYTEDYQTPVVVEAPVPLPPPTTGGNPFPIWLVCVLALSCAGGSLFIFKSLTREVKYRKRRQSSVQRVTDRKATRRKQVPRREHNHNSLRVENPRVTAYSPREMSPPRVAVNRRSPKQIPPRISRPPMLVRQPVQAATIPAMRQAVMPRVLATQPMVTVLPPDASIAFDQGQQSLADVLDIRRQQSLSSLLRQL